MSFIADSTRLPKSSWKASRVRVDEGMPETTIAARRKIQLRHSSGNDASSHKRANGFASSIYEECEPWARGLEPTVS
jgi:hypothetical protein